VTAVVFIVALLVAGTAGAALLFRATRGLDDPDARIEACLAFGLPFGLVLAALPGWTVSALGWLPLKSPIQVPIGGVVVPLGLAALAAALVVGFGDLPKRSELRLAHFTPFAVMGVLFLIFTWFRWVYPDIRSTEKPMDFAILSTLVTAPSLPIDDPWLAGHRFTYYHFSTFMLALPTRLSKLPSEVAFNVFVPLLAGLAGSSIYGAVRLRRGGRGLALFAAAALLLAGTLDGARQVLIDKKNLVDIDFWLSERRVAHAITEWPLFTYHLGDLHPHVIALPLFVALAGLAGRIASAWGVGVEALLLAALLSANPWDLPGSLLILAAGNLCERPFVKATLRSFLTLGLALPLMVTFLFSPRPPTQGIGFAGPVATTMFEAFLHLGVIALIPVLALLVGLVRSQDRDDKALLAATFFPALAIGISILTVRPVLGIAIALFLGVAYLAFRDPPVEGALRAGYLLAAAGAVLIAIPEVVVVLDSYGEEMRRMNTVFKCYVGGYALLAIATALLAPVVLATRRARVPIRLALILVGFGALFHPASYAAQRWNWNKALSWKDGLTKGGGFDGLRWMTPGDRKVVDFLRKSAPAKAVIAEAPGEAYHDNGRIGSATGRPIVLGWANHQLVWRGGEKGGEFVAQRKEDLKRIFQSHDPEEVKETLKRLSVRYVVVGEFERQLYGNDAFPFRTALPAVVDDGGTALYEVK